MYEYLCLYFVTSHKKKEKKMLNVSSLDNGHQTYCICQHLK
jgi:hypothetical protein